jgi:hypothetical protein
MKFLAVIMVVWAGSETPQKFTSPDFRYETREACESDLPRAAHDFILTMKAQQPEAEYQFNIVCDQEGAPT